MSTQSIYDIKLGDIEVSDVNVRPSYSPKDDKSLEELANSIKKHGLLQPVVLSGEFEDDTPYSLIAGQRRLHAHQKLGAKTIKAVFAGKITRTEAVVRSLVENMTRLDLDYEDTSRAITHLYYKFGKDDRKIAAETGLSLRRVREFLAIEEQASSHMKTLLKARKVSMVDVKRVLRAAQNDLKKADRLLDLIVDYKPTVHQRKRLVEYGTKLKNATADQIIAEAMKPHIERNLIVSLTDELRDAMEQATKKHKMDAEELATQVLEDWLKHEGFTK